MGKCNALYDYKCRECDQSFISVPHLKFHIKSVHDTPCGTCGSLCEFECAETGVEMMKFSDMRQNQAETINRLEKELIKESIRKSGVNIELKRKLQTAVMKLDRGENDKCLNELCNLAYLPGWAVPKLPHNPDRKAAEEWVKMEVYTNSLEEQIEVANSS